MKFRRVRMPPSSKPPWSMLKSLMMLNQAIHRYRLTLRQSSRSMLRSWLLKRSKRQLNRPKQNLWRSHSCHDQRACKNRCGNVSKLTQVMKRKRKVQVSLLSPNLNSNLDRCRLPGYRANRIQWEVYQLLGCRWGLTKRDLSKAWTRWVKWTNHSLIIWWKWWSRIQLWWKRIMKRKWDRNWQISNLKIWWIWWTLKWWSKHLQWCSKIQTY